LHCTFFSFAFIAYQVITREKREVPYEFDKIALENYPAKRPDILSNMVKQKQEENDDVESCIFLIRINDMVKNCWDVNPEKRWSTAKSK